MVRPFLRIVYVSSAMSRRCAGGVIATTTRGCGRLLATLSTPDPSDEFDFGPLGVGVKVPRKQRCGEAVELVVYVAVLLA